MHHSSMSWEITLLYFFSWNFLWFLQKESIKVQNFRLLTGQVKFHQICTLIGSFCWKYIKKYREVCLKTLKSDAEFEEKLICFFTNDNNLVNFDSSIRSLKNLHFDWFLLCKVYNVWPKKVQSSYLIWHWRAVQNLKKNWLAVWKMTWWIWQNFTRALESLRTLIRDPLFKVDIWA